MDSKFLIPAALLLTLLVQGPLVAQSNLLNAKVPQEVAELNEAQIAANDESPLAYGYVDDRDILWSKTVWEIIDLDERINYPFYYPTDTFNLAKDRRSLFDVLKLNLGKGQINEVYDSPYFNNKLTYDEILEGLSFVDTLDLGIEQLNNGEPVSPEYINRRRITAAEIEQYRIKGTWYFDKRLGELRYRLLGICPVAKDIASITDDAELVELFWIWFPNAREVLNKYKVFNGRNSSQPITFDAMLNARRFNSVIYKEENIYEDRTIENYISKDALRQLLESERIKSVIRDFEQDMWNN